MLHANPYRPYPGGRTADLPLVSRREMLCRSGAGFGALALPALLAEEAATSASATTSGLNPLAPKAPHFKPRAKHVIFLYMPGGPPHLDTFDPKAPALMPPRSRGETPGVAASPFRFKQYGQSGLPVS